MPSSSSTPNTPDTGGKALRSPPEEGTSSVRSPTTGRFARPGRSFSGPRVARPSGDATSRSSGRREGIHRARASGRGGPPVPVAAARRGSNDEGPSASVSVSASRRGMARSKSANMKGSAGFDSSFADLGVDDQEGRASSRFARIATASASNTTQTTPATERKKPPTSTVSMSGWAKRARSPAGGRISPTRSKSSGALLRDTSNHSLSSHAGSNASLNSLGASSSLNQGDDGDGATTPQPSSLARMQNSTFNSRFLMDDSSRDHLDPNASRRFQAATSLLGPSMTTTTTVPATTTTTTTTSIHASAANSGTSTPTSELNFNMSTLKFPTVLSSNTAAAIASGIFDDDDDHVNQNTATSRFSKAILSAKPSIRTSSTTTTTTTRNINVFASRQDLREVDQSVNLMDANAGTYESSYSHTQKKGRKARAKRQSMVEVFLGEQGTDHLTTFGGGNGAGSSHKKKKNGRNTLYRLDDESCCDRFTHCLSSTVSLFIKILCSLPVLILVACFVSGLFLIPMLVDRTEQQQQQQESGPVAPETNPSSEINSAGDLWTPNEVDARLQAIQDILLEHDYDLPLANPEALQWMAAYDPAMTELESSPTVLERFAVVAIFFSFHPDALPEAPLPSAEEEEQQQQRRQLSSSSGSSSSNLWMSEASICQWQGIECNDVNQVIHLNVSHSNLQGELPEELSLLTNLKELDLSHNLLHGTIPKSYPTKLSKLQYVWLHANQIRGSIPAAIGEWETVYHMDLSENQLTGALPASLARLTQIRLLFLHDNYIEGSIPLLLGHLPNIEYLWLGQNELTGELPMDLLSKLTTIVDLRLHDNQLTGSIPPEIESLHHLEVLSVANNRLAGELPDVFDRLHYLEEMDLSNNSFTGSVPESLASATSLERLILEHNKFAGDISVCDLPELTFISADCLDGGKVTCSCCDKCY